MIIDSPKLNILKYFLLFFLSIFIFYSYVSFLQHILINPDAGYYLWVVNKISEGKIPGTDFKTFYMPLSFYLLSTIRIFTNSPSYIQYFTLLLIIQMVNALLLFFIAKQYTTDRFILIFASLFYLLMSFHSDGCFFVLEPFVNLFGLLSLLSYLRFRNYSTYWMLVSGILSALSFFCKQYGLVYFLTIPILLLIDYKKYSLIFKRGFLYVIGYFIPFVVFILYYRSQGWGIKEIITNYSGSGYGQRSMAAYLSGLYTLIKIYCIFLPFSLWVLIKKSIRNHILVYLYLIVGFSFQFAFYKFSHYYLLFVPHLILLAIIIFRSLLEKRVVLFSFILLLLFTITINIYASILTVRRFLVSDPVLKENLIEQTKNAIQIRNYIGKNDKVLLFNFDLATYYFLSNLNPPLEKKYGLICFSIVSHENYFENIIHTDYVLIRNESVTDFYTELKSMNIKWIEIRISNDILLLKKSN